MMHCVVTVPERKTPRSLDRGAMKSAGWRSLQKPVAAQPVIRLNARAALQDAHHEGDDAPKAT